LQAAGHAAVAVPERVDHHEVQVRHRAPDDRGDILIQRELHYQLVNQPRHRLCIRPFVNNFARGVISNPNWALTPKAGACFQVVLGHHEMETAK